MNKGLDAFGEAVATWLNRRYTLARPVDPASEVLVLNGTREGLFLAALAAKRLGDAARRAGRPCSFPIRFMRLMPPARSPPIASRSICRRPRATGFLPDLDALER